MLVLTFLTLCDGTGEAGARDYDKTLYDLCMARFLYVRCSDSFQFLQTLKVNELPLLFSYFFFCKIRFSSTLCQKPNVMLLE